MDGNVTALQADIAAALTDASGDAASVNAHWVLVCAFMVFLMQLGFAYVEAAGVRATNVQSIVFKNLGDCCLGALCWWATGFGIAFGDNGTANPVTGTANWFLASHAAFPAADLPAFLITFAYGSAAATIVSGAVAERISLSGYYTLVVTIMAVTYPAVVHWMWSAHGWLSWQSSDSLGDGAFDFAGGAVIHVNGGIMAAVAAYWVGPRRLGSADVFTDEGRKAVKGHDVFEHAVGTLILWFCWFPFNGGGVVSFTGGGLAVAANATVVTLLSGASAVLAQFLINWTRTGLFNLGDACNCALAGLVAATAPGAFVAPAFGPFIGVGATICYMLWQTLRRRVRIDDVLDASSVHFGAGVWGTLCVGLCCDGDRVRAATGGKRAVDGLFFGGGVQQLGIQMLSVLVISAWGAITVTLACVVLRKLRLLRVSPEEELAGCDEVLCGGFAFEFNEKLTAEIRSLRQRLEETMEFPSNILNLGVQELENLEGEANRYRELIHSRLAGLTRLQAEEKDKDPKSREQSEIRPLSTPLGQKRKYEEHFMPPPGLTPVSPTLPQDMPEIRTPSVRSQSSLRQPGGHATPAVLRRVSALPRGSPTGSGPHTAAKGDSPPAPRWSVSQTPPPASPPSPVAGSPTSTWSAGLGSGRLFPRSFGGRLGSPRADAPTPPLYSPSSPFKQFAAALVPMQKENTQHNETLPSGSRRISAPVPEPDFWEPHGEDIRPPTPPPAAPPTPPDSDEDWDPAAEQVDEEHASEEEDDEPVEQRAASGPPSKTTQIRVWIGSALFLCAVTGASAANSSFGLSYPTSAPQPISDCPAWMEEAATQLNEVRLSRAQFNADLDAMWILVCGFLVFLMQLGFSFIEAGAVRAMNVQNIIFKNLGDCCIGALAWWATGYGVSYGNDGGRNTFIGTSEFFLTTHGATSADRLPMFFLSYTYGTTACTIVSGAIAERVTLLGYYIIVVITMAFSYPVIVHWVWSEDGWLAPANEANRFGTGMFDFAGSAVIHMSGGMSAFVSTIIIGTRKLPGGVEVFSDAGQRLTAPHNKFNSACGTLMLWFSWFGFNAGSVHAFSRGGHEVAANAAVTTLMSGSSAVCTALLVFPKIFGHYDLGHTCNAALSGLVSVTAGCAYVSPAAAIPIGVGAALVYVGWHRMRVYFQVDDVLDASSVHFAGGAWGILSVGLFADATRMRQATGVPSLGDNYGLFMGGGVELLGTQFLGALAVAAWAGGMSVVVCFFAKMTVGLRVPLYEELEGIDKHLCGGLTYDYLEQLETQMDTAETAAEAIAAMRLEDLKYLWETSTPSRLDSAFKRIVENLREYAAYLPESILNPDSVEKGTDDGSHETPALATPRSTGPAGWGDQPMQPRPSKQGSSSSRSRISKKHVMQTLVGVQLYRGGVIVYATLKCPRGQWTEQLRSETTRSKQDATQCEICRKALLTAEFCSITGKRHEPPPASVSGLLSAWLETVVKCQEEYEANFEGILGCDVVLSFETAKKCGTPCKSACAAAVALREGIGKLQYTGANRGSLTCGISGGGICAGNIGGVKARRRVIVGDAMSDARILSNLAAEYGVTCLVESRVAKEALQQGFAGLREVANVQIPEHKIPRLLFHLDACAPEPLPSDARTYSGAWDALMRGDTTEGLSRLTAYSKRNPTDTVAEALLRRAQAFVSEFSDERKPYTTLLEPLKETPVCLKDMTPDSPSRRRRPGRVVKSEKMQLAAVLCVQFVVPGTITATQETPQGATAATHGAVLQELATTVRQSGGSVAWAGDERLLGRWWADSPSGLSRSVACLCTLLRSEHFNFQRTSERKLGVGLAGGRAWFGRTGGETDHALTLLGNVTAKAEVMAWASLADDFTALAEGVPLDDTPPDFGWELVAERPEFRLPPATVIRCPGAMCRLQRLTGAEDIGYYETATELMANSEWTPARHALAQHLALNEDVWASRLLECLESAKGGPHKLRFAVSYEGVSVSPSLDEHQEKASTPSTLAELLAREASMQAPPEGEADVPSRRLVPTLAEVGLILRDSLGSTRSSPVEAPCVQWRLDQSLKATIGFTPEPVPVWQERVLAVQRAWRYPVLMAAMWNCFTVMPNFAFASRDPGWSAADKAQTSIDYICDAIVAAHIALTFLCPFRDLAVHEYDRKEAVRRYLRDGFIIDALSVAPWELLWVAIQGGDILLRQRWLRMNRLLQIVRFGSVDADQSGVCMRVPILVTGLALAFLWLGCIWGLGVGGGDRGLEGFLQHQGFTAEPVWYQAAQGFFVALQMCWYGSFQRYPQNDEETVTLLVLSVVGLYVFAASFSYILFLLQVARPQSSKDKRLDELYDLRCYMQKSAAPKEAMDGLFEEYLDYHRLLWKKMGVTRAEQYEFLYHELPTHLCAQFKYSVNSSALECIPALAPSTEELVPCAVLLVSSLELTLHPPGQRLLRRGHRDQGVYFVVAGAVEAVAPDYSELLACGDFWGEMTAIWGEAQRATVRVTEPAQVYRLSNIEFRRLARAYPAFFVSMYKKAEERARVCAACGNDEDMNSSLDDLPHASTRSTGRGSMTARPGSMVQFGSALPSPVAARVPTTTTAPSDGGLFAANPLYPPG